MNSRTVRAVAGIVVATLLGCGHHRRAELQIVLHVREDPWIFHYFTDRGIQAGVLYSIHWSLDLVETSGRASTLTAIDVTSRVPGRPDQIQHDEAASPDLYGVTYDSSPDYFRHIDPEIPAFGTLKVGGSYWSVGWNGEPPPDHAKTLVIDITVHYRDSEGDRVSHLTAGPGLNLEVRRP